MRQQPTRKLFAHWSDLMRKGAPPDRNDLEPAAFAAALQDVFILGRSADGVWSYRVAGTRLAAYADRDLRGEAFADWWRLRDRADVLRLTAATAEDKTPVIGGVSALSVRQERHILEFILLPLRHGGQDGLRMIGGFFPTPETARIYDLRLQEMEVLSLRTIDGFSSNNSVFGQPRADIDALVERRHGLRVIEGGLNA